MEQSDRIHLGSVGWHLTQEACTADEFPFTPGSRTPCGRMARRFPITCLAITVREVEDVVVDT